MCVGGGWGLGGLYAGCDQRGYLSVRCKNAAAEKVVIDVVDVGRMLCNSRRTVSLDTSTSHHNVLTWR